MKIKRALIPFIPITLLMIASKLLSLFGLDSDGLFMGMSGMTLTYIVIGLTLFLFLVCVVINIFDRKTAPVYAVRKNPLAGFFAILSGLAVAASSVFGVVSNQSETEYYVMTLITAAISIPAAIALIMMSKVHFVGKSTASSASLLYIFPSLWGCAELVTEFLNATKVSVSATDMTALFCYIFLTLYLFSHSMIVSKIKGRHPVKACFIYGLPAAAVSITFGIYEILYASRAVENLGFSTILVGAQFLILGLYIISFIFELSGNVLTKDEIEIIDSMPDDDDPNEESYASTANYDDELVISQSDNFTDSKGNDISDYVSSAEDINDFIMGYDTDEEEEPIPYFTKDEMEKSADFANTFVTDVVYDESDIIRSNNFRKSAKAKQQTNSPENSNTGKQNISKTAESASIDLVEDVQARAEQTADNTVKEDTVKSEKAVEEKPSEIKTPEIFSNKKEAAPASSANEAKKAHSDSKADRTDNNTKVANEKTTIDKRTQQMNDIDALLKTLDDLK